jgi:hypothetical protein
MIARIVIAITCACIAASSAFAQSYPASGQVVVPRGRRPARSGRRAVFEKLSASLKQTFVIENAPARQHIGTKPPPGGARRHTLCSCCRAR